MNAWREIDSEIHYVPNPWLGFAAGCFFFLLGVIGTTQISSCPLRGAFLWAFAWGSVSCAAFGAFVVAVAIRRLFWPLRIRHALPAVLPGVPDEPVLFDGLMVHSHSKLKIVENAEGWDMQPARDRSISDRMILTVIGILAFTACAGTVSGILHDQLNAKWPAAIAGGAIATLLFAIPMIVCLRILVRLSYRRLCRMSVSRRGDEISLELPEIPETTRKDLGAALRWAFSPEDKRTFVVVPRSSLRAAQLCPCLYATGTPRSKEISPAVQGLLVFEGAAPGQYQRLPLLLTSDFDGAARLMQQIAARLGIPYLFSADEQSWQAEKRRAAVRAPLKVGGRM